MAVDHPGDMTLTLIILLNTAISLFVIAAVAAIVVIAHRLPSSAPHHDELWGNSGNPWVVSDPLPFTQISAHEREREQLRAA